MACAHRAVVRGRLFPIPIAPAGQRRLDAAGTSSLRWSRLVISCCEADEGDARILLLRNSIAAIAWASSAFSASCRSMSISSASIRLASPYQMSLVRENGMSSRCEARRMAAFTESAAGRGSAHRRTRVRASSIEEAYDEFGNLITPIMCYH
jgi:hypothetical protein